MDNSQSVYNLLTKLCEKHITEGQSRSTYPHKIDVKRTRSKCYELLLSKRLPDKPPNEDLENNKDPHCLLLAWKFQLMTKYSLPQHAEKLQQCLEKLQRLDAFRDATVADVIYFLLQLRKVPKEENRIMEVTLNKHYSKDFSLNKSSLYSYFDESKFRLPEDPDIFSLKFSNEDFQLQNKNIVGSAAASKSVLEFISNRRRELCTKFIADKCRDEGYESPSKSLAENIWEVAAREPPSNYRTWEAFGCVDAEKELPFLSESGPQSAMLLQNVVMTFENLFTENSEERRTKRNVMSSAQFVKDLKYLLVGVESKTFQYNDKQELTLTAGTCIEGLSPATIESYCQDFLFCSRCYKGLNALCTPDPFTQKYIHNGYIFLELCNSIKRYLSYYRVAVLSMSDKSRLLAFNECTKQLRTHITVLASVCKVGPFAYSGQVPHGVFLLNYLYEKVMSLTNKDVIMVLYSVLYPCCQAYFSRFLEQWILEGSVQDIYGEFFISVNTKYTSSRGRTYWTRSYTVREDIVPNFINGFQYDILFCGKAMNLLKLCVPNSPLCLYLLDKHPDIISCCISSEQLAGLEQSNHQYYLEATALSGPRLSFSQTIISLREQSNLLLDLIVKKRAATLSRIELERKKEIQDRQERRQKELKVLREQYMEAMMQKQVRAIEKLDEEIKAIEERTRLEILEDKILQEEANNLIDYYNKLFEQSEQKRRSFEKRAKDLRKFQLDEDAAKSRVPSEPPPKSTGDTEAAPKTSQHSLSRSISTDTFHSTYEELPEIKSDENILAEIEDDVLFQDIEPLDVVNTNPTEATADEENGNNVNLLATMRNFQAAQRNKAKVLATELGIVTKPSAPSEPKRIEDKIELTDAQKNKLKVLSSEYGIALSRPQGNEGKQKKAAEILTDAQRNKLKVMSSNVDNFNKQDDDPNANLISENFRMAQKNKAKVMSVELDLFSREPEVAAKNLQNENYHGLTEAQKNKLKVMSHEFGYDINVNKTVVEKKPSYIFEINRNKMMASNECFLNERNKEDDNKNVIDETVNNNSVESHKWVAKKQDNLSLDFTNIDNKLKVEQKFRIKSPKFELDKISPMSVDSTPLSGATSPSNKVVVMFDKGNVDSTSVISTATASTAAVNYETGFNFDLQKSEVLLNIESRRSEFDINSSIGRSVLTKSISVKDAVAISPNCLRLYLQESISTPLLTQIKLVTNELLKYFIKDLHYLEHLNSLRNYFFLMDGEFGRNITNGLFEKLYDANFPIELINCHTLQTLVYKALDYSIRCQENYSCLSFKINNSPKVFNLGDPDVFDCISLTYKVTWPLNILLPSDTIAKYDEVFKFLLKLHRVGWVLQNLFQDLKSLMKETPSAKVVFLMASPQYRRLHQCRHVMTHFIQTLQSYVNGEVLQSSWKVFENNLEEVTSFDQLYSLHAVYIKNILFMCLLNQKSAPLRKVLQRIFIVILKFYDYLRSRTWCEEDGTFVHPNFKKLEDIFANFEELTQYLFKVGNKVVKSGYQPHLLQLLNMLDINNFYSKGNAHEISLNT